ncbi:hypothetical protein [Pseudogulbenkiania ferrooxidans]|uniref:Uncharacterized protein n=1 Tax=Pseudogulbenkiania ferrooxidans 2002 TaxID=279714 RepID=B9Z164_9NEIS|nr:hypothetical protein [Pseudogulbenkiania ferrooxidans]EEG09159.1 hypothetical protein FuraDRAFT_1099 [Pseudogulbenkiania ferrooxidans 2002]
MIQRPWGAIAICAAVFLQRLPEQMEWSSLAWPSGNAFQGATSMNTLACLTRAGANRNSLPMNWYTLDVVLADDFPRA